MATPNSVTRTLQSHDQPRCPVEGEDRRPTALARRALPSRLVTGAAARRFFSAGLVTTLLALLAAVLLGRQAGPAFTWIGACSCLVGALVVQIVARWQLRAAIQRAARRRGALNARALARAELDRWLGP